MLLHDEIIFSRAFLLNKIKNGIFSTGKLRRKHALSGICKISVKIIFLEPGKFQKTQKLSSTFKNLRKA